MAANKRLKTAAEIAAEIAPAYGINLQDTLHGQVLLAADGSNPSPDFYSVPVQVESAPETIYARYPPYLGVRMVDGMPVLLAYNKRGELEITNTDDMALRDTLGSEYPPINLSFMQHTHESAAQGGQLNASNIFNAGTVGVTYGGSGANLSATGAATHFVRQASTGAAFTVGAITTTDLPTVPVTKGGTGLTTLTNKNLLIGAGTSNVTFLAPSTSGFIVQSNGTDFVSAALNLTTNTQITGLLPLARGGANTSLAGTGGAKFVLMQESLGANITVRALTSADLPTGTGTVTSVGLSTDSSFLTVGSSPVTTSGTITLNLTTGLTANRVLATPDGTTGTVSLRALVNNDLPVVTLAKGGTNADLSGLTTGAVVVKNSTATLTAANWTAKSLIIGNGTGAPTYLAPGTAGKLVRSDGTDWQVDWWNKSYNPTDNSSLVYDNTSDTGTLSFTTMDSAAYPIFLFKTGGGTLSSPTQTLTDAVVGEIDFRGYNSADTDYRLTGFIQFNATEDFDTTDHYGGLMYLAVKNAGGISSSYSSLLLLEGALYLSGSGLTVYPSLVFPGISNPSAVTGGLWYDTGQVAQRFRFSGITTASVMTMFTQATEVTVGNTGTETTLLSASVGTLTFPADFLKVGKIIRCIFEGYHSTNSSNTDFTMRFKVGGTTVASFTATLQTSMTTRHWKCEMTFGIKTTGSSGSMWVEGRAEFVNGSSSVNSYEMVTSATTTINTTTTRAIDLTADWVTANSNNTITCALASIEILN